MTPGLLPGDEFVVNTSGTPRRGDIVVAPHPHREDFWLVKRLAAVPGDMVDNGAGPVELQPGEAWLVSDNRHPDTVDSFRFGPVELGQLAPRVTRLDADTFQSGVELLASEDPALSRVCETFGRPEFWARPPGFRTLVILILEQQVSLESAAAVFSRLRAEVGEIVPATISQTDVDHLNRLGLTKQKATYIKDLADAVQAGSVDFNEIAASSDRAAMRMLTGLRGIGTWTAEAYLLSADRRLDIFPLGDRALQVGTAEVLSMSSTPDPDELEILSEPWRPIRSVAARIIWHGYLSRRGRSEPIHD